MPLSKIQVWFDLWCLTPLSQYLSYYYFINIYSIYIAHYLIKNYSKRLVISWQSVLLVEENGVPGETDQPVPGR